MPDLHPVTRERHRHHSWQWSTRYDFAAGYAVAPIFASELGAAVAAMPVAFVETAGRYSLFAVTSLLPGQNFFVGADGQWRGRYIPAIFRLYPFRLLRAQDTGTSVLGVDEASGVLDAGGGVGTPFFAPDGTPSSGLQEVATQFRQYDSLVQRTEVAIAALAEAGIIQPWPLQVSDGKGGFQELTGLHRADEGRMNELSDEAFAALRQAWALPIAYGQLYSTNQVQFLAELGQSRQASQAAQASQAQATQALGRLESLDSLFDMPSDDTIRFR